jgi:mRNA interferase MazF
MTRGEVWWADLGIPFGSEPGFRRPVLIVQADAFNRSRIRTVIIVPITSNTALAEAPGNVFLPQDRSGLTKDSVVNVSQAAVIDRQRLLEPVRGLAPADMQAVDAGLRLVLGLG